MGEDVALGGGEEMRGDVGVDAGGKGGDAGRAIGERAQDLRLAAK